MITESLLHFPHIGPKRLTKLHAQGLHNWHDVVARANELSLGIRDAVVEETQRCLAALESRDIAYFVANFAPKDQWRILAHYIDEVSFFDIETSGLEQNDPITVIVCWHNGEIHTFVEHENLDDFLALLDDVKLLSSFNGGSFDVPRVLDAFHIPKLPCPHLDLRWLCYHQGLRGGLKEITHREGFQRPHDLMYADGELAIRLWARWEHFQDAEAKADLLRYCASDVLLLVLLAEKLVGRNTISLEELWAKLPVPGTNVAMPADTHRPPPTSSNVFGDGSPSQLRGRRRRAG